MNAVEKAHERIGRRDGVDMGIVENSWRTGPGISAAL
jgi:hypothetical protein